MNSNIIKYFFVTMLLTAFGASPALGSSITVTQNHPSIMGEFQRFRLTPRTADLPNPCVIGTMYVNTANQFQFCRDESGVGVWGNLPGYWTQSGNNIYLRDSILEPELKVGIGTITPEFKLTLINNSGILALGSMGVGAAFPANLPEASRLIWYPRKAAFLAGYFPLNQADASIGDISIALGRFPVASQTFSNVGGGDSNTASATYATVLGGQNNIASAMFASITGGMNNAADGAYSTITGGQSNITNNSHDTVLGGNNNQTATLLSGSHSVIGGGENNLIEFGHSVIVGGSTNTIGSSGVSGDLYATLGGGANNSVRQIYGVVGGGNNNHANRESSSVGGGADNYAGIPDGTIDFDGNPVPTSGEASRVSGGQGNSATGDFATVSGGLNNRASGENSTVLGGENNTASGDHSVVGGGSDNTASGLAAVVMGGSGNDAGGDYSWAGGQNIRLTSAADNTFAWGFAAAPLSINTANAFLIAGDDSWFPKVGIRTISPQAVLELNANGTTDHYINLKLTINHDRFTIKNTSNYIGISRINPTVATHAMQFGNANNAHLTGGGQWINGSSRAAKDHIEPLASDEAEKTLDDLQPMTFVYKAQPGRVKAGFIAEDVPNAVALPDRKSLSAMDIIAVLTKTAQSQQQHIERQQQHILELRAQVNRLKETLDVHHE